MPLDTTEFDKRIEESKGTTARGLPYQGEAVMQLALEVVKATFPDLVQRTHAKVSAKKPDAPARGSYSYGIFSGSQDGIKLANTGRWSPAVTTAEDGKSYSNFTTSEVLQGVETVLHEMYHARTKAGFFRRGGEEAEALMTPELSKKLNQALSGSFASLSPNGPLDMEEMMAGASAILDMRDRGLVMEGSRTSQRLAALDAAIKESPVLEKIIGAQRDPDIASFKGAPRADLGTLLQSIATMFTDTSVKETRGGVPPGTRRKDLLSSK